MRLIEDIAATGIAVLGIVETGRDEAGAVALQRRGLLVLVLSPQAADVLLVRPLEPCSGLGLVRDRRAGSLVAAPLPPAEGRFAVGFEVGVGVEAVQQVHQRLDGGTDAPPQRAGLDHVEFPDMTLPFADMGAHARAPVIGCKSTVYVDKFDGIVHQQKMLIMTPAQCQAARALIEWTQPRLATAAGLGLSTVVDFEKARRAVSPDALTAIRTALEAAGVEFIAENGGGAGVRLRKEIGK